MKKKARSKKPVISVNNRLKEYGNEQDGKIEINVRKHRGDKSELADTVHHELLHHKYPKASEKKIQKKTKIDMSTMSYSEKEKLASKVRAKGIHYREGALKRKFKMGPGKVEPGAYIQKMKDSNSKKTSAKREPSLKRLSIMGLV